MISVRLVVRSLVKRESTGRTVLLVIVGAVVFSAVMVLVTSPVVVAREGRRNVEPSPAGTQFGPRTVTTRFDGRTVALVAIPSGESDANLPPGLTRAPGVGEVFLSPALARAARADPDLDRWFPYRRGPELTRAALVTAGDYRAYIGVDAAALGRLAGMQDRYGAFHTSSFGIQQVLFLLIFVALPAVGLVVAASRFGRGRRSKRYAALRLLGFPDANCRLVMGGELGLPVLIGSAVVAIAWARYSPGVVVVPVVQRRIFYADAQVAGWVLVAAVVATGAAVGLAGAMLTRPAFSIGKLQTMASQADRVRLLGALVFVAGLVLVVVALRRSVPRDPLRWWSLVLLGVGLPSAVAFVTQSLARLAARPWLPPWLLFGTRRLSRRPRESTRVAASIALVIFAFGSVQTMTQVIASGASSWESAATAAGVDTVAAVARSFGEQPLRLAPDPPGAVLAAVRRVTMQDTALPATAQKVGVAIVGTCADLGEVLGVPVGQCTGRAQPLRLSQVDNPPGETPDRNPSEVRLQGRLPGRSLRIQVVGPTAEAQIPSALSYLQVEGAVLVPPSAVGGKAGDLAFVGAYVRLPAEEEAWQEVQAWVASWAPGATAETQFHNRETSDGTTAWVALGLLSASGLALAGAALAAWDDSHQDRGWASLTPLGVSRLERTEAHLLINGFSTVIGSLLASASSLLFTFAILRVNDDTLTSYAPYWIAAFAGVVAGTLYGMSIALVPRPTDHMT